MQVRSAASGATPSLINDGKFCSSASGCSVSFFLRFLVGVQRAARNDQENLAALAILSGLYARARTERGAADGLSNNGKQGDC